jgi:hypothetical protein
MHIEIDILMSTYVIITTVDLGLQKKKRSTVWNGKIIFLVEWLDSFQSIFFYFFLANSMILNKLYIPAIMHK